MGASVPGTPSALKAAGTLLISVHAPVLLRAQKLLNSVQQEENALSFPCMGKAHEHHSTTTVRNKNL